jgi:transcriptional regulator with XRE-family HTH domain
MHGYGRLAREMRELLGLSQEQLGRIANVSQGAVSRFERGDALSTPWIIAVKIRVALAARLRQLDPDVLTDDARRFLEQTALFGLSEDPALPPRTDTVSLLPAPGLTGIVRAYSRLPESARAKFVAIMSAVAGALANGKD